MNSLDIELFSRALNTRNHIPPTRKPTPKPMPTSNPAHEIDALLAHARADYATAHPNSQRQFEQNQRYMPGANSRSTLFYGPFPLTITGGEGATLRDADGHAYTDFIAEYTAGVYGHSAPEIRAAVVEAMERGINLCGHNLYEGPLARLVCERIPSVERVRFTNSGTEANLMAITAALRFTGRPRIAVCRGGYHGGVLSFGDTPGPTTAPYDFLMLDYNDAEGAVRALDAAGDSVAAVLVEPMLGASGCIPAQPAFLHALREATQRIGALLVFDEVMTSRLAPHGIQGELGIRPDLTTLGKYLGGGMSFGAFGGREDIMAQYDPRTGALAHSGTFNNNVITMAAGIAGLSKLYPPAAAAALSARGTALRERLNGIAQAQGVALQFTGVGSAMNAHFVGGSIQRPSDAAHADPRLRELMFLHLLREGFYIASRGFIVLSLPLSDTDIDRFQAAIAKFIGTHLAVLPRR